LPVLLAERHCPSRRDVEVVSRLEAMQYQHWTNAFGSEAKDRRYYELVEDTIHDELNIATSSSATTAARFARFNRFYPRLDCWLAPSPKSDG